MSAGLLPEQSSLAQATPAQQKNRANRTSWPECFVIRASGTPPRGDLRPDRQPATGFRSASVTVTPSIPGNTDAVSWAGADSGILTVTNRDHRVRAPATPATPAQRHAPLRNITVTVRGYRATRSHVTQSRAN